MLHALKNQINLMAVALLLLLLLNANTSVCVCIYNKQILLLALHRPSLWNQRSRSLPFKRNRNRNIKKNAKQQKEGKKQTEICTHTQLHSYTLIQTPRTHTHTQGARGTKHLIVAIKWFVVCFVCAIETNISLHALFSFSMLLFNYSCFHFVTR